MKICILHIGHTDPDDTSNNPPSPMRFRRGISPFIDADWTRISAVEDALPNPTDFDAYLITGGKYAVYENYDWQDNLMDFIRTLHAKKILLAGICYGHQAIAHALGGTVELSPKGYGIGLRESKVIRKPHWMQHAPDVVTLYSMHKRQVTQLPDGAIPYLTSDFCPQGGFTIGNHIFTIQQHPDFNAEVSRELITKRQDEMQDITKTALNSLLNPHHTELSCQWIADFFAQHKFSIKKQPLKN